MFSLTVLFVNIPGRLGGLLSHTAMISMGGWSAADDDRLAVRRPSDKHFSPDQRASKVFFLRLELFELDKTTMFRTRHALTAFSRRTFSTTRLHFHPSRLLATPIPPSKLCLHTNPCIHRQIRHQSSEPVKGVPNFIKSGDWICGKCQAHNYSSRMVCFECQDSAKNGRIFYKPGAWHCPTCNLAAAGIQPLTY
jgi:hypothetical protein